MNATQQLQESLDKGQIKKVVFVRPGRVGDLLFITPLLRCFKERYPEISLSLLVSRYASEVVRGNPLIDHLIEFDPKAPRLKRWFEKRELAKKVAEVNPDLAIVMSRKGKEVSVLKRAGVQQFHHFPDAFLDNTEGGKHVIEQLFSAIESLDVKGPPKDLELYPSDQQCDESKQFLAQAGIEEGDRFAVLHPGCFQVHNHKLQTFSARRLWPLDSFRGLAQKLHDEAGLKIVLSGSGPQEEKMVNKLASDLTFEPAIGTELGIRELGAVLKSASLLVTVDTGPLHIGTAMGTPLVALFGPSPVHYTRPWREANVEILRKDLPCSPCRGKGISCFDNICMKQITVDEVFEAAMKVIPGKKA